MKNIFHFKDHYYPFTYVDHIRICVRGVLLNEEGKVAILHLECNDDFGYRNCYELPGGGKKKDESFHQGVKREIKEETGFDSEVITFLGRVDDYYNLIHRENHNYYYLLRRKDYVGKHLEDYEKEVIQELMFLDIDEIINLMENVKDDGVGLLVAQREIPILKLAKEYINEHLINK